MKPQLLPNSFKEAVPVQPWASVYRPEFSSYDRLGRCFRPFIVELEIGSQTIEARSSLEAGAIFMRRNPGVVMHDIKDSRYERREQRKRRGGGSRDGSHWN